MPNDLPTVARQMARHYLADGDFTCAPLGAGLINATYLITPRTAPAFVLQRLNRRVFPRPTWIIDNLLTVLRHRQRLAITTPPLPSLLATQEGRWWIEDEGGEIWRALSYITPSRTIEHVTPVHTAAIGRALGEFHASVAQLPLPALHDTLPGFHITPAYLQHYQTLAVTPRDSRHADQVAWCRAFIEQRAACVAILEDARAQGLIPMRVIHGDPKLEHFLFTPDAVTIAGVIDLDTVKPGLIHYDIGDCVRSCCYDGARQALQREHVAAFFEAYHHATYGLIEASEWALFDAALWLIPFELGLRFFSDYLVGDIYFKVQAPDDNLRRASEQFRLVKNIEHHHGAWSRLITGCRTKSAGMGRRNG